MESKPLSVTANSYESDTSNSVKVATPDILILQEEVMSPEVMTDLIFEDIGGQEIINIARNDVINGQQVLYQPIKNITNLYYQYNPQNILALQQTDKDYFKNFPIRLSRHLPECGSGYTVQSGQNVPNCNYVYIDPVSGDLVIDVINMGSGQDIEVQIIDNVNVLNDTIY